MSVKVKKSDTAKLHRPRYTSSSFGAVLTLQQQLCDARHNHSKAQLALREYLDDTLRVMTDNRTTYGVDDATGMGIEMIELFKMAIAATDELTRIETALVAHMKGDI